MTNFPLPLGTHLAEGEVVGLTLTAYEVVGEHGTVFVPFVKVHPPVPAEPLVVFGG